MGSGRRKTENKLIGCKHARRVSFSKRRSGLFKKAGELSTLTGCEIAVLVFSQAGRNYSFGYPSVESVIQRFHKNQMPFAALSGGSVTLDFNQESDEIHKRLDRANSRGKKPVEDLGSAGVPSWLGTPVHELSYDQLIQGKECLNKHMEMIGKRIAQISEIGSSSKTQSEGNVPDLNFDPSEDEI